ncbi:hypothetical protein ACHZ97_14590 [Lysobacter soli]|uniref:hypothetical protein n=1 Tax=Lysobacter soli TaxID=453783 RepID=UPI0037C806EF
MPNIASAQSEQQVKVARALGMNDLADKIEQNWRPITRIRDEQRSEERESRRLDAPLLNTGAGRTGQVVGVASQLLGPGILARGSSIAPALLPTSIRGSAVQGGVIGSLEPVAGEGERGRNILIGTAAGGGGQAALRGAGAAIRRGASVVPSISRGQQERAAANVLREFATDPDAVAARAASPQILVEGTQPTLAEATEDAGIISLQRALRNRPELQAPLAERETANNLARVRAIQQGFGGADEASSQAIRDAANQQANVAARGLRSVRNEPRFDPFANVGGGATPAQAISLDPVTAGANALIQRNTNRPVVQQALSYVRDLASRPIRSADEAWNLRKTINDLMEGKVGGDQAAATAARRELITLRGLLDREMTRAYPQWGEFLRSYRGASRAADQIDVGQALLDTGRAVRGATNEPVLTPAAFSRAAGNLDRTVARAVEFRRATADKILEPKQRQLIDAVRRDLERFSRAQGANLPPAGSATVSNAMGLNKVQDAMGPLAATAIEPVSGLALALVNNLRTKFGQEVAGIVNEAVLNPQRAAEILARLPPRQRTAIVQQVAPVIASAARNLPVAASLPE